MKLEFFDSELECVVRISSVFSLNLVPRIGEKVFLPHNGSDENGGTYKVLDIRYTYWCDPQDSEEIAVQLAGIVVYVNRLSQTLAQPATDSRIVPRA